MGLIKIYVGMYLVAYCLHASASEDVMCKRIAKFANSSKFGDPLSIYVVTDWENMTKSCVKREDKGPEKELCEWMIENISIEFMHINVSRIMQCLSDNKLGLASKSLHFRSSTGEFWAYEVPRIDTDVAIKVNYSFGEVDVVPNIRIEAKRIKE